MADRRTQMSTQAELIAQKKAEIEAKRVIPKSTEEFLLSSKRIMYFI